MTQVRALGAICEDFHFFMPISHMLHAAGGNSGSAGLEEGRLLHFPVPDGAKKFLCKTVPQSDFSTGICVCSLGSLGVDGGC